RIASNFSFGVCTQLGPSQVSSVQRSLSLHVSTLQGMQPGVAVLVHPSTASQASAVQGLLSSQLTGVWTQPRVSSHLSVVHAELSAQIGGMSEQRPSRHEVWQRGPHLSGLASVHGVHVGSETTWTQRFASRSHESVVHMFKYGAKP